MLPVSRQRQKRIYEFIKGYISSNKQSPTIREIAAFIGYKSVSGVHDALRHLERKGLIRRNKARAWRDLEIVGPPKVHCPQCKQDLDDGEFGVCRARSSGRNLYCKSCIRNKVNASREVVRQMKAAKRARRPVLVEPIVIERKPYVLSPTVKTDVDRVRDAMNLGRQTWGAIKAETKLGSDSLADAFMVLILDNEEVKCDRVNGERIYRSVVSEKRVA